MVCPSPYPTYLHYLNTSAITMLIYTFNNATAVILILSVISIMAPQVRATLNRIRFWMIAIPMMMTIYA